MEWDPNFFQFQPIVYNYKQSSEHPSNENGIGASNEGIEVLNGTDQNPYIVPSGERYSIPDLLTIRVYIL